jgi:hypothetical protein
MLLDFFILLVALSVLCASELIGYFVFVRKFEPKISLTGRLVLGMAIITMMGGFIGAFSWWFQIPGSFAWEPPPLVD